MAQSSKEETDWRKVGSASQFPNTNKLIRGGLSTKDLPFPYPRRALAPKVLRFMQKGGWGLATQLKIFCNSRPLSPNIWLFGTRGHQEVNPFLPERIGDFSINCSNFSPQKKPCHIKTAFIHPSSGSDLNTQTTPHKLRPNLKSELFQWGCKACS